MVTNFDYIRKWLQDMKIKKFTVWKLEKQGTANRNNGYSFASKDDTPLDVAIENLEEWCKNNSGCYVLTQTEGSNSNNAELEFCLPFKSVVQQQQQPQKISGMDENYFSKREFETLIENERLKMKLERLEEEIKLLKENTSASGEFFKTITPFVGPIVQGFLGSKAAADAAAAPTQIGSIDAQQQPEDEEEDNFDISEEEFKQLKEDLVKWSSKDPEYLIVIHKLAAFTDNPMYNTAKGMLFNQ